MATVSVGAEPVLGDVEIGTLLADRTGCRVLMALNDGRALAASVLADEAGVAKSTATSYLAKLTEAGLLQVETHGRHRYYRLAGPHVGELLAKIGPMRDGNRHALLRAARTCYDHLAGRLGVGIMGHMLASGHLVGGDGRFHPGGQDQFNSYGRDVEYSLTPAGRAFLDDIGITIPDGNRPLIRYCIDWSEQRHHLAGQLGRAILDHFLAASWIRRAAAGRSVQVTPQGRMALAEIMPLGQGRGPAPVARALEAERGGVLHDDPGASR